MAPSRKPQPSAAHGRPHLLAPLAASGIFLILCCIWSIQNQPNTKHLSKIKHIYWFAYYNLDEPSVRYRALYALQQLEREHQITYDLVFPSYQLPAMLHFFRVYLAVLLGSRKQTVVVYQKIFSRGIYAHMLKLLLALRPKNTLYDIDDAEYVRRPASTIRYFMKRTAACAVGSQALFEYAAALNKRTFMLTSPVIAHGMQHRDSLANRQKQLRVGWIGYYDAHRDSLLSSFFPALQQVDFEVKLIMLGVRRNWEWDEILATINNPAFVQVEADFDIDWHNEQAIYACIASFDVGVSPLLDDDFNRAKSAFKLKQCLSCGVPVLASKTGENAVFLQEGVNGFFCETPADYLRHLCAIRLADEASYTAWSEAALRGTAAFDLKGYTHGLLQQLQLLADD